MSLLRIVPAMFLVAALGAVEGAKPPDPVLNYQGRIEENDVAVEGNRYFRFSVRDAGGAALWQGGEQILAVSGGLYAVKLTGIPASVLDQTGLRLRIEVGKTTGALSALSPDIELIPALQAVRAFSVAPGSVGTDGLADGAVTTAKIADGSITAAKLAAGMITQTPVHVRVYNDAITGIPWTADESAPIELSMASTEPRSITPTAWNNTTRRFVAPVKGLYQVSFLAHVRPGIITRTFTVPWALPTPPPAILFHRAFTGVDGLISVNGETWVDHISTGPHGTGFEWDSSTISVDDMPFSVALSSTLVLNAGDMVGAALYVNQGLRRAALSPGMYALNPENAGGVSTLAESTPPRVKADDAALSATLIQQLP